MVLIVYEVNSANYIGGSLNSVIIYLYLFASALCVLLTIEVVDLIFILLGIGEYKNKNIGLKKGAFKVVTKYFILIFTFFIITTLLEFVHDFDDKSNEFVHYSKEYKNSMEITNYVVKEYKNSYYFSGKRYNYWTRSTFFKDDKFTDDFITLNNEITKLVNEPRNLTDNPVKINNGILRNHYKAIFKIDNDNKINNFIEDLYYVVQTVSTLGYGNILPNEPRGMLIATIAVLCSQFITTIGIVIIIREEPKGRNKRRRTKSIKYKYNG